MRHVRNASLSVAALCCGAGCLAGCGGASASLGASSTPSAGSTQPVAFPSSVQINTGGSLLAPGVVMVLVESHHAGTNLNVSHVNLNGQERKWTSPADRSVDRIAIPAAEITAPLVAHGGNACTILFGGHPLAHDNTTGSKPVRCTVTPAQVNGH